MSVLGDTSLLKLWPNSTPEPASIDLHLGDELLVWSRHVVRDPRIDQSQHWKPVTLGRIWDGEDDATNFPAWVLRPGYRYLVATRERIRIPSDCAGQLAGRSSWGRDGLAVICGPAGWCDPGYVGNPTLELSVVGSELVIWPGAACLQLIVFRLEEAVSRGYGHPERRSRYQGDRAPVPSRMSSEVGR